MTRCDGKCETLHCTADAVNVHHLAYNIDTMAGKRLESLRAVCARCHSSGHRNAEPEEPKPAKRPGECLSCKNMPRAGKMFCSKCMKVIRHPNRECNREAWSHIRKFVPYGQRLKIVGKR
jgi:hypothetical protein